MPDHRLPETDDELRSWIMLAWEDGWRQRGRLTAAPTGRREEEHTTRLHAFLRSWDLTPPPPEPKEPLQAALQRMVTGEPIPPERAAWQALHPVVRHAALSHGVWFFRTEFEAVAAGELAKVGPHGRVVPYSRGYAVQWHRSGPYLGPESMTHERCRFCPKETT